MEKIVRKAVYLKRIFGMVEYDDGRMNTQYNILYLILDRDDTL